MSDCPKISVIVLTYNSSNFIIETLESIKRQDYNDIELIITDDSSKDNTMEICRAWLKQNAARFVNTQLLNIVQNTGIPANCNRGISASTGEWIKLIAGDDILADDILSKYISILEDKPEIGVIHSDIQKFKDTFDRENFLISENRANLKFNQKEIDPKHQFQILLRENPVYAPTVMIKRELYDKYGLYNEKYTLWEDRPMWLNLTSNGIKFYYIDYKTVFYRIHTNSISINKNLLFSSFDLKKEEYLLDYYNHLPFFERKLKMFEFKRKKILFNNGISEINFKNKLINKITGLFVYKLIFSINKKYK